MVLVHNLTSTTHAWYTSSITGVSGLFKSQLMSTKPQHRVISANDWHNLSLLQQLFNHNPNFASYAASIKALFFFYLHNCTQQNDDFALNTEDVQGVLELVHALQNLKHPRT